MDVGDLRFLAENSKDTRPIGHTYYYIFLRTGAVEDLGRAISQIKDRLPTNLDDPHYAARLKGLIVTLIKKFRHARLLEDLQEAIFRVREMVGAVPMDHPDQPRRCQISDVISAWQN
ncbi:hypothetical protein F4814DRAFT_445365 [Daldinia grandis]|nr:hypothetical protein F4814DRAFT_445365 [Daldinia grandis]